MILDIDAVCYKISYTSEVQYSTYCTPSDTSVPNRQWYTSSVTRPPGYELPITSSNVPVAMYLV